MTLARLPPERRKAIAAMGGAAARPELRTFAQRVNLAREAGRKGGQATQRKRKALLEFAPAL